MHWDGIEYYSAALGRGVLYAFRGFVPHEPMHRFRLSGLSPHSRYALRFQHASAAQTRMQSGEELMRQGVSVALPSPLTSELVFFQTLP